MGRHALLVATGLYEDPQLSQLRAPAQDVSRLAAVLEDPAVGGFDEVRVPSDSTDYEIRVALTDLLADRDRDDLVLAYFSCHGISTLSNRLFFAATNTVHKRPAGTAVARSFVNEQMEDCHAASRILLLDCCFSGAYSDGMKSAPATVMGKAGEGYVVLTASDALEYSWEADTLSLEAPTC
jgi:chaperonin GroEL